MLKTTLSICLVIVSSPAWAGVPLTDLNIKKAVLGEAIGETIRGKEAVARTILNRHSLKQVNGLHNPIIKTATPKNWLDASNALKLARTRDITNGAIGWGNKADLIIFQRQAWFKKCVICAKIEHHFFYKLKPTK